MKIETKFKEYVWLVNTIMKAKKISFADIQKKWLETDMSEGIELARSTFFRHKDAIEDIFGIYIECDRSDHYRYYIGNEWVLTTNSVQNWMLSTISVNNELSESLSLQDRILLEEIPIQGNDLRLILKAMKNKVRIDIKYRKYGCDCIKEYNFEPYCIKLFRQRWYVLGHFHKDATEDKEESDYFAVFSFDRIHDICLTNTHFEIKKDFNASDYFEECFGVVVGDGTKAERVVVRAYGKQRFYIRDLPIHVSQTKIHEGEGYADYELRIRPTMDFCGYVLSRGCQLKVLSPEWLADKIHGMLDEALRLYTDDENSVGK